MHGVEAKGVDCPAIDGIIEEADDIAGEVDDKEVLDAALAAAAQAVEHYEITRYGTLIAWAKQLGRNDCATRAAEEPGRGEGGGQEAHPDRRGRSQPQGRELSKPGDTSERVKASRAEAPARLGVSGVPAYFG